MCVYKDKQGSDSQVSKKYCIPAVALREKCLWFTKMLLFYSIQALRQWKMNAGIVSNV